MKAKWQSQAYAAVMQAHDDLWPEYQNGIICRFCGGGDQHIDTCAFNLLQLAAATIKARRPVRGMDKALQQ